MGAGWKKVGLVAEAGESDPNGNKREVIYCFGWIWTGSKFRSDTRVHHVLIHPVPVLRFPNSLAAHQPEAR